MGKVEEVPAYQRRPFIRSRYRLQRPQLRDFWSAHNEVGNMWTHIVALFLMANRFYGWLAEHDSVAELSWPRSYYFCGVVIYYLASFWIFGVSVQYHWHMSARERDLVCWRCLDQSSCLLLVLVGYFVGIPLGFHCHDDLRFRYMALTVVVALAMTATFLLSPKGSFDGSSRIASSIIAGAFLAVGPAMHWLLISPYGRRQAGGSFLTCILYGCMGSTVFVQYIPECWFPGRFDLIGSSHQLWHVLIFLTIVKYGDTLATVFELTARPELFCAS